MGQAAAPPQGKRRALRRQGANARQWWGRAAAADGHERQVVMLVVKSAFAATAAWLIADGALHAQTPAFAPFSAVLIIQVTAYQSLLQALRYLGAVVAGVVLQGAFGLWLGPTSATFALVALMALVIGRWRRLGSQGSNVSTAAFFAFSTYAAATSPSQGVAQLVQIIVLVLIGCGTGVLVNVVVLPPMRYRSAEYGIRSLGHSLGDLVDDLHPQLIEGTLEKEETERWRQRARDMVPLVRQAHASAQTARESTYYNPYRLLQRNPRKPTFAGYAALIDALERVTAQLDSMIRSLDHGRESLGGTRGGAFLARYGEFLACFGKVAELLSRIDEDRQAEQTRELRSYAEETQECEKRLTEDAENGSLPLTDPSQPYGILVAEAGRLLEEIWHTHDVLRQAIGEGTGPSKDEQRDEAKHRRLGETKDEGKEGRG